MTTAAAPAAPRTHRLAVAAWFFLQGLIFSSWASRIPAIQQRMGFSDATLGLLLLAIPLGQLPSLPLTGWLIHKYGSRHTAIAGAALYSLSLVGLGWAEGPWLLVPCLVAFGFASNLMNISINTQAVGVEALYEKPIMASFHGVWSLAGFTGALIGTAMIGWGVLPEFHFLLITGLVAAGALLTSGALLPHAAADDEEQPAFVMPDRTLLGLGAIAFCALICEGAMFDWSGVYFKKVVHAEKAWVGAGYTAFMSTMALGRFGADRLTARLGSKRVIQLSGMLTAFGLLVAVLFPTLITAVLGFMLVGFGTSSVVPLVYSAAGRSTVMPAGMALAAVSTIGFLGFLVGPPIIGIVAGATSLRVSYALIAVMGVCVAAVASRVKL
ncbi:MFS transporter [Hymenobacter busanensis]|uniref:MFS transporter n=1 Tax=Hymenobacter busanensis TaxID=2607656 RepID=A0A7L4ZY29_9BACT|nr:MFS transporter [Hymenobacter busanensis]KAA9325820.1 MFS transporter [Hymenobacter busanensis]QHJ06340.1 MFS transporter [Hymenobacter busanensis]